MTTILAKNVTAAAIGTTIEWDTAFGEHKTVEVDEVCHRRSMSGNTTILDILTDGMWESVDGGVEVTLT